ncbi:MAG: Glu/Leu/Phe/Val dehydrogenase [Candidatus Wallbacteria bacterium]|nr:Glu/Leu/Phe/Val dehydrogenase [Candidatus Wallbacteria bacterium]
MGVFEMVSADGYEQVDFWFDKPTGLKAIIAIHSTTLGPALGGVRMWPYKSEEEALTDVLRLAKGMTYKAAAAGLNLGGGKAVIIGDPKQQKSEALLRAFGRAVESLHGRYITAEDMGTNIWDMDHISVETRYVTGLLASKGGSGDPSPVTAYGVYTGLKACCKEVFGDASLNGKTVAIQGTGSVGYNLAKHVYKEGGRVVATDVSGENLERVVRDFNVETVKPEDIYGVDCDIFAPCAVGAVINDQTINRLKCKIIAGAANNQLEHERHGDLLHQKGILYAPDFVINAGGLLNVYEELHGYNRERAMQKVGQLFQAITSIVQMSRRENIPTYQAANHVAEDRIRLIREVSRTYLKRN